MSRSRRSIRGGVLVQALIVLAGLVALMATLAASQRLMLDSTQSRLRTRRAEVAARSAVSLAMATLASVDVNHVTLDDDWATLGANGDTAFELGDATYRLEIIDAGSRVSVNAATEAQLEKLTLTPEQRESLLDWREDGTSPRADGAKDEYYNALTRPYNTRLGALLTLSELLLVRHWTAHTLYETPDDDLVGSLTPQEGRSGDILPLAAMLTVDSGTPNTRADGSLRINLNVANVAANGLAQFGILPPLANQVSAAAPYTSFADLLQRQPGLSLDTTRQLLDGATFNGNNRLEGKINVNTASQAVLETLPNVPADVASAIVARQPAGLATLGELTTIPGLSGGALAQVADLLTVGGDTFIVRARGESGGVSVAVEAVIGVRDGQAKLLRYERLANPEIPLWWDWETEATSTTTPGASQ